MPATPEHTTATLDPATGITKTEAEIELDQAARTYSSQTGCSFAEGYRQMLTETPLLYDRYLAEQRKGK